MKKKRAVLAALGLVVGMLMAGCGQKAGGAENICIACFEKEGSR